MMNIYPRTGHYKNPTFKSSLNASESADTNSDITLAGNTAIELNALIITRYSSVSIFRISNSYGKSENIPFIHPNYYETYGPMATFLSETYPSKLLLTPPDT